MIPAPSVTGMRRCFAHHLLSCAVSFFHSARSRVSLLLSLEMFSLQFLIFVGRHSPLAVESKVRASNDITAKLHLIYAIITSQELFNAIQVA